MEDDLTRRAVLKASARANGVLDRLAKQIPYGPSRVGLKPAEIRKRFAKMSPEDRTQFVAMIGGPEFALEFFNGIA